MTLKSELDDYANLLHVAIDENHSQDVIMYLVSIAPQLLFQANDRGVTPMSLVLSKNSDLAIKIQDYLFHHAFKNLSTNT